MFHFSPSFVCVRRPHVYFISPWQALFKTYSVTAASQESRFFNSDPRTLLLRKNRDKWNKIRVPGALQFAQTQELQLHFVCQRRLAFNVLILKTFDDFEMRRTCQKQTNNVKLLTFFCPRGSVKKRTLYYDNKPGPIRSSGGSLHP